MHNDLHDQDDGQEDNARPVGLYILVGVTLALFVLALLRDAGLF